MGEDGSDLTFRLDGHRRQLFLYDGRILSSASGDLLIRHDFVLRRTERGWEGECLSWARFAKCAVRWVLGLELLRRGGLLLHGSTVVIGGRAHLFAGPSESGKTTIATQSNVDAVLSDELSIVGRDPSGRWCAWPSPFWGQEHKRPERPQALGPVPLAGIWILNGWETSYVTLVKPIDAAAHIYARATDFGVAKLAPRTALDNIADLTRDVPASLIHWRKEDSLATLIEPGLEPSNA
jgi:hypothetical protein